MEYLCSDPFIDFQQSWNTEIPDFSRCFQDTILTWIPCAIIFLSLPCDVYKISTSNYGCIPWNMKNVSKMFLLIILIGLTIFEFENHYVLENSINTDASGITSGILIMTFLIMIVKFLSNRCKGIQSSGSDFLFWSLLLICDIIRMRSLLLNIYQDGSTEDFSRKITLIARLPLVCAMFLFTFLNDGIPTNPKNMFSTTPNPEDTESFLSNMMFWWITPLMKIGADKPLKVNDVPQLNEEYTTVKLGSQMEIEVLKNKDFNIVKSFTKIYAVRFITISFVLMLQSLLNFVNPYAMSQLMKYSELKEPLWKGLLFCYLLLFVNIIKTIIREQCVYKFFVYGMQVKTALIAIIYQKSLRLSNTSKQTWSSGEVVSLVSVDVQRIQDALQMMSPMIEGIPCIIMAIYFLVDIIGVSSLAGVSVFLILIPLNFLMSHIMKKFQVTFLKLKDKRIRLISEVLDGIKILKLYAWELPFQEMIQSTRRSEIKALKKSLITQSTMTLSYITSPLLVLLLTFSVYIYEYDNVLTPKVAFITMALFNIIRSPMGELPYVIGLLVNMFSSVKRISSFMRQNEVDEYVIKGDCNKDIALSIEDGSFSWDESNCAKFSNINMEIKKGDLVAIIGSTGSGKSSLLSAILGDMYYIGGKVNRNGRLAYVPQQSWIENNTLEQNVLFNLPCDKSRYNMAIEKSALLADLEILTAGDKTEIGEKGVNLSGGQKQRVSIARAIYNDADIYLFDDPLSAVDAHVGKHIFENVIGPGGVLSNKTRVLVTHNLKYLEECDCIFVMNDCKLEKLGSYKSLLSKNGNYVDILKNNEEETKDELKSLKKKIHSKEQRSKSGFKKDLSDDENDQRRCGKLVDKESLEEGSIDYKVYLHYFKNIGLVFFSIMVFSYLLFHLFDISASIWLSNWSSDFYKSNGTNSAKLTDYRIRIFSVFVILQTIVFSIGIFIYTHGSTKGAEKVHNMMLSTVLKCPMSFFDTTPMGRMMNRFSRDVNTIDTTLFNETDKLMYLIGRVFGAILIICISIPLFIIVAIVIIILYYNVLRFSLRSLRQLMRLESIYRSPIYSHIQESINGVSCLKAYNVMGIYNHRLQDLIDTNQKFYYAYILVNCWISVLLQVFGAFIVFFTAFISVHLRESVTPSTIGLTLNYALTITLTLYTVIRTASIVEVNVVSVERVLQYTKLENERPYNLPCNFLFKDWPSEGRIKFTSFRTKYREGLDYVLKGLNLDIKPSEKIGVVGRTGAGKSSLSLALFRIIESSHGMIQIDNVDISKIGLHQLRKSISIIPQDPVLFSGSFRMNLDPAGKYSDEEIWTAIDQANLKRFVMDEGVGLNYAICEGGRNMSVGQRQLVCLARALLKKTKILVLDEATAAIDIFTDELIQKTIKENFKNCTIITIAHRISSIMDSDRVIVLSEGYIAEMGPPQELMEDTNSRFYKMTREAGSLNSVINSKDM